jgi:hypothetical protein
MEHDGHAVLGAELRVEWGLRIRPIRVIQPARVFLDADSIDRSGIDTLAEAACGVDGCMRAPTAGVRFEPHRRV